MDLIVQSEHINEQFLSRFEVKISNAKRHFVCGKIRSLFDREYRNAWHFHLKFKMHTHSIVMAVAQLKNKITTDMNRHAFSMPMAAAHLSMLIDVKYLCIESMRSEMDTEHSKSPNEIDSISTGKHRKFLAADYITSHLGWLNWAIFTYYSITFT